MQNGTVNAKADLGGVELLRGAGVVFVGSVVGRVLSFLYHALLARFLGAREYGVFVLGLALFNFAGVLADLGLREGIGRDMASALGRGDREMAKATIRGGSLLALGVSLVAAVGLLAIRPWAAFSFKATELGWILSLFAPALPFATVGAIFLSALQALRRVAALSVVQYLLDPTLRIATFVGLTFVGWQLFAAVASHLLASVAIAVVAVLWLSSSVPLGSPARSRGFRPRHLIAFSLPLLITHVVGFVLQWTDTLLLGYYLTAREVGVYAAAGRLAGLGGMFLTAVSTIFAPKIYALYGQGDLAEVGRLYQRSTRWIVMLAVPLFLYTALNAQFLLALFGPEFVKGVPALLTLAAATLVMTGTGPVGDMILMTGRSKVVLYAATAYGALGLWLNVYMVPRWGLLGAALATGLTLALSNLANVFLAWRFTGLQPYTKAIVKPILLAVCVAALQAALAPLAGEGPLPRLVAGAGVWLLYPLLLWRLGLEAEDLEVWKVVKESKACVGSSGS